MFPAFVINLDRDTTRWASTIENFGNSALQIKRVSAVDGTNIQSVDQYIDRKMWLVHEPKKYNIKAHVGCFLSHRKAWKMVVEQNVPWALVLEDDMRPDSGLSEFLQAFAKDPPSIDIVRINTNSGSRLPKRQLTTGIEIGGVELVVDPLGARSSGAYLISGTAARRCLAYEQMIAPIDHFEWLFQRLGVVHVHTRHNLVEQTNLFDSNIAQSTQNIRFESIFSQITVCCIRHTWVRIIQARNLAMAQEHALLRVDKSKE